MSNHSRWYLRKAAVLQDLVVQQVAKSLPRQLPTVVPSLYKLSRDMLSLLTHESNECWFSLLEGMLQLTTLWALSSLLPHWNASYLWKLLHKWGINIHFKVHYQTLLHLVKPQCANRTSESTPQFSAYPSILIYKNKNKLVPSGIYIWELCTRTFLLLYHLEERKQLK